MGAGENAYVYAKACGIMASSFLGERAAGLAEIKDEAALFRAVFPESPAPEKIATKDLQSAIIARTITQVMSLLGFLKRPARFLARVLRSYEYADLKNAISALIAGDKEFLRWTDLGRFSTVDFAAYPDVDLMLRDSEFTFLLTDTLLHQKPLSRLHSESVHTLLDKHYYTTLAKEIEKQKKSDVIAIKKLLFEEISLNNAVWALRLRYFYNFSNADIKERLIKVTKTGAECKDAIASMYYALDNRADWAHWKRLPLLNKDVAGSFWKADPRHFEKAASLYLYNLAKISFHRHPFAADTLALFIRLKQFEEQILCGVAEAVSVGLSGADILAMTGLGGAML